MKTDRNRGVLAKKIILTLTIVLFVLFATLLVLHFWGLEFMQREASDRRSHEHLTTARNFVKARKLDEGIVFFQKELKKYPTSSDAHSFLALMYLEKGEVDKAMPVAEKSLKLDDRNVRAYSILGICYEKKGDLPRATTLLQNAVNINPRLLSPHYKLAEVLARRGYLREAMSEFTRAKELSPLLSQPSFLLGRYEANFRNYAAAVTYEQAALKEDSNNTAAYCFLAQIYLEMRRYDDAIKNFEMALTALPEDGKKRFQSIIYNGMGMAYYRKNDYDRAIWSFRKSLEYGEAASVHKELGDAYLKKGMNDMALTEYEIAKKLATGTNRLPEKR